MFNSRSRRFAAAALVAGCLSLTLAPAAASAASSPHARPSAAASTGLFSSVWSLLVRLWAGDYGPGPNSGPPGPPNPHADEGPGMCPHGGH